MSSLKNPLPATRTPWQDQMAIEAMAIAKRRLQAQQHRQTMPKEAYGTWLRKASPTFNWDWPHMMLIQEAMDRMTAGSITRLMIFVPPRHGKSEAVTIRYPAYRLERDPSTKVIVGSYNQDLAETFSRRTKGILSERGICPLDPNITSNADWLTTYEGGLRAAGVGSGVTGRGGDLIIIDDPIKSRVEAASPAYRKRVVDWYTNDLYTRLEPNACMVLIMTRWHEEDLAGYILSSEEADQWTVIKLPAEAERHDPLGRAEGEALCPDRYPLEALHLRKKVLGSYGYASLFQQRPTPAEGGMFLEKWFEDKEAYVDASEIPADAELVRYWDHASTQDDGDYTAGVLLGFQRRTGLLFLIDIHRGQWGSAKRDKEIVKTAIADRQRFGRRVRIYIEQQPSGAGKDQVRAMLANLVGFRAMPDPARGDKEIRADNFASVCGSGLLRIVRGCRNLREFVTEAVLFPYGANDDMIDSASGGTNRLTSKRVARAVAPIGQYGQSRFK